MKFYGLKEYICVSRQLKCSWVFDNKPVSCYRIVLTNDYFWIFLIFCWLSKGPGKHGGRWQQGRSMVGQCHSYLEFMTKQIELLFNHFIIWIGSICYFKLTFWKNHSHNFSMFCDILSSWKWLACLSKISILGSLYFRKT